MLNERFRGDRSCFGQLANVLDGQFMNCVVASIFALHLKVAFANVVKTNTFHFPSGILWVPRRNENLRARPSQLIDHESWGHRRERLSDRALQVRRPSDTRMTPSDD